MEPTSLTDLPQPATEAMVAHARFCFPAEACGLIAGERSGNDLRITMVYSLTNADDSPTSFTIEPAEHFGALQHAERNGWELIGAFHSHPNGAGYPSQTDVVKAAEPDWAWCVIGLGNPDHPDVGVFSIANGEVRRTYPQP